MRYHSTDNELIEDRDEDVESQTTFEAAKPASFDHVAEQTSANPFKVRRFLIISISSLMLKLLSATSSLPHSKTFVLQTEVRWRQERTGLARVPFRNISRRQPQEKRNTC